MFFPILGTITANIMHSSSLLVIRLSRRQRLLGKAVNPIPWAFSAVTSFVWLIYGVMKNNYFIVSANAFGVIMGLFSCTTALILLGSAREELELVYSSTMEFILICGAVIWIALAYVIISSGDFALTVFLVGMYGTISSIIRYMAPMTSVLSVFKMKDASSIYAPQLIANCVNCTCWTIYGLFGVGDVFVYIPPLVGIACSAFLLSLKTIYPSNITVMLKKDDPLLDDIEGGKEMHTFTSEKTLLKTPAVQDFDRKRGFSDASYTSETSHSSARYRGRLASGSEEGNGIPKSPPLPSNTGRARRGSVGYFERNGMLMRVGSDFGASEQDSVSSKQPPSIIPRGRAGTLQAVMQYEGGGDSNGSVTIPAISKIQEVMESAVVNVRNRAESVFQMVEDRILTSLEPILGIEVIEASSNLQSLYQEQQHTITTEKVENQQISQSGHVRDRSASAASSQGSAMRGGTTAAPPTLETILERDSSYVDSSFPLSTTGSDEGHESPDLESSVRIQMTE